MGDNEPDTRPLSEKLADKQKAREEQMKSQRDAPTEPPVKKAGPSSTEQEGATAESSAPGVGATHGEGGGASAGGGSTGEAGGASYGGGTGNP